MDEAGPGEMRGIDLRLTGVERMRENEERGGTRVCEREQAMQR
jgi:hypothetical protein